MNRLKPVTTKPRLYGANSEAFEASDVVMREFFNFGEDKDSPMLIR